MPGMRRQWQRSTLRTHIRCLLEQERYPVVTRSSRYWRQDIGSGGIVTRLTPTDSVAQGDLLHVDGTYEVTAKTKGVTLVKGQYQQLWRRIDGQWRVQHEIWRLDPLMQRNPETAQRLASLWTTAYNAGDAKGLTALYDKDAILAPRPGGNVVGTDAIGSFWAEDFGGGKPTTTLTLTDVYMAGDLAHLEGEYRGVGQGKRNERSLRPTVDAGRQCLAHPSRDVVAVIAGPPPQSDPGFLDNSGVLSMQEGGHHGSTH